jgi:ATP-dependent protease HslVU (ClpYQ) peptidase subunit
MTCVVAMISDDTVYMGADSAGSNGWGYHIRKDPKVFYNGDFLIGFTTSFRMGQLLMFNKLPEVKLKHEKDMFKFMVKHFVPAIRNLFEAGGFSKIESNRDEGGEFLVGYGGRIFRIYGDFQVSETVNNYDAVGCGEYAAIAALRTLEMSKSKLSPSKSIKMALKCAESIHEGVKGPFLILPE